MNEIPYPFEQQRGRELMNTEKEGILTHAVYSRTCFTQPPNSRSPCQNEMASGYSSIQPNGLARCRWIKV
jgi:hypothetical protein